ncbi:MAG: hypothetical protein ACLGIZ_08530 [Acidimicrobiia bacterium]
MQVNTHDAKTQLSKLIERSLGKLRTGSDLLGAPSVTPASSRSRSRCSTARSPGACRRTTGIRSTAC